VTEYLIPLCHDHQREHAEQIYRVLEAEGYKPRRDSSYIQTPHDAVRTYDKGTYSSVKEGPADASCQIRLIKFALDKK